MVFLPLIIAPDGSYGDPRLYNKKIKFNNFFDSLFSDPYIRLQILPDKQHNVKTEVFHRTLDPVYEEDFIFYGVHFNRLQVLLSSPQDLSPKTSFSRFSASTSWSSVLTAIAVMMS